jgi:hypothetical protein
MRVSKILITIFDKQLIKEVNMCASSSGRAAEFFSASGKGLSEETTERKVKNQSACALNIL